MKRIINLKPYWVVFALLLIATSCSEDFLEFRPTGVVSSGDLEDVQNVESMVISAYASLGNDGLLAHQYGDLWAWGTTRSDDGYKGGGGIGDQFPTHQTEVFSLNDPSNFNANLNWKWIYAGISRVNDAMSRIKAIEPATYQAEAGVSAAQRLAEMRFVRGHYEFILKSLYKYPVFVDEDVPKSEIINLSNRVLNDQQGWEYIAEEFRAGVAALPDTQIDEGRPTKNAARAYLAKVLMFKAYVQDDRHQVTSITSTELEEAVSLIEAIEATSEYGLYDDYAKNFLWENDFNSGVQITSIEDTRGNNTDPRIAHTVGLVGMPFKYDPNRVYDESYARVPGVYGFKLGMKDQELPSSPAFRQYEAFFSIARNTDQIRWAEVLLWKAEALIELNRVTEALPIINQIRQRAISDESLSRIVDADGNATGMWRVGEYTDLGSQDNAREILRMERRLELAFESKRFFDLVRWGIAAETLNGYFDVERSRVAHLTDALFTAGRDEYLAIPQEQITVHFGIGAATKIDELQITWLSGQVETYYDLAINQTVNVTEGGDLTDINNANATGNGPAVKVFPNPFENETYLSADLPQGETAELDVFSVTGQHVWRASQTVPASGKVSFRWNDGNQPAGTYIYRLSSRGTVISGKLIKK